MNNTICNNRVELDLTIDKVKRGNNHGKEYQTIDFDKYSFKALITFFGEQFVIDVLKAKVNSLTQLFVMEDDTLNHQLFLDYINKH